MSAPSLTLRLVDQAKCGAMVEVSRRIDVQNFESSHVRDHILIWTYLEMRLALNRAIDAADSDDTCPHDK